jgi:hypothetical protein
MSPDLSARPPEELAGFFEAMVPFLRGTHTAQQVEAELGASPSGTTRLAFYRTLIVRDVASILHALFPITRAALRANAPGLWGTWVAAYEAEHPAQHYEPNEFGRHFPDFVRVRAASDDGAPRYLHELSDYEWTCHAVGVAISLAPEDTELVIRHYDHDIPALVNGFTAARWVEPQTGPVVVTVYPDPTTRYARVYRPTANDLLAIARRFGSVARSEVSVDALALDAAEQALIERGVLPSRVVEG